MQENWYQMKTITSRYTWKSKFEHTKKKISTYSFNNYFGWLEISSFQINHNNSHFQNQMYSGY